MRTTGYFWQFRNGTSLPVVQENKNVKNIDDWESNYVLELFSRIKNSIDVKKDSFLFSTWKNKVANHDVIKTSI